MTKYRKTFHNVYVFTDEFLKDPSPKKDVRLLKRFKRGEPDAEKNVAEYVNSVFQMNPKSAKVKCVKAKDLVTFNGYAFPLPYVVWDLVCASDDKAAFDFVIDRLQKYQEKVEKGSRKK